MSEEESAPQEEDIELQQQGGEDEMDAPPESEDDEDGEIGCNGAEARYGPENIPLIEVMSENSSLKDFKAKSLHELCREGDVKELQHFIDQSEEFNLNILDEKEVSPLHLAVRYTNIEIVEYLLDLGADPNVEGPDMMSPLAYAARYGGTKRSRFWKRGSYNSVDEGDSGENEEHLVDCERVYTVGDSIDMLLNSGACVNSVDKYKLTALHHTAIRGNVEAARVIVGAPGVNKEPRDLQGSTPLHLASTYNRLDTLQLFLKEKANPKCMDFNRRTPLHEACQEGNMDIINALIFESETNFSTEFAKELIKMKDSEGNSPLSIAISSGCMKAAERLLEYDANPNTRNKHAVYAIHCAARTGDMEVIQLLVEQNAEVNVVNKLLQTPLYLAALNNHVDVIRFLVDNGANPNLQDSNGFTPLHAACKEGNVEAVNVLIEWFAKTDVLDYDDRSILFVAAAYNQIEVIKVLLEDENCSGLMNVNDVFDNLPLHVAAKEGNVEAVHLLIEAGADIDNKNEDEKTALHLAAQHGRVGVVEEILKGDRCSISDIDEDSNTPLHIACTQKRYLVSKKLLEYGAETQSLNVDKWTPLDCAAASGAYKCVEILLENGAQIDPLDRSKTTPLHLAAKFGHEKTVRMLLSNGASLKMEDAFGQNALEIALLEQNKSVVKALIESPEWKDAFRTSLSPRKRKRHKVPQTPLRLLIQTYPELVETVLDSCITTSEDPEDPASKKVVMNYEFLDDSYLWKTVEEETKAETNVTFKYCHVDEVNGPEPFPRPYNSNGRIVNQNHPLMIMAKEKNRDLLRHPLCLALVRHKWQNFGRYVFYGRVFLYSLFLIFLTSYLLLEAQSSTCLHSPNSTTQAITLRTSENVYKSFCHIGVLIGVILNIIAEILEIVRSGIRYFSLDNLMDWVVSGLSLYIIFTDSMFSSVEDCSKWDVSAILITLAWLNLLVDIRQLPYLGIYVIMFFDILLTFIKFGVIFMVFIVAFGLGFHMLHYHQDPFEKPGDSFLKVTVMMIGEYEYTDMFFSDDPSEAAASTTSKLFFGVFVVIMSLIVMNLLVGLAVEDIKAVQDQAVLKRLVMQAELVLDVERHLPNMLRRLLTITSEEIRNKKRRAGCLHWLLSDIMSSSNIIQNVFEYNEEPALSEVITKQNQTDEKMKRMEKDIKKLRDSTEEIKNMLRAIANHSQITLADEEF